MKQWPFTEPPNVATVTVRQITQDHHPVLLVVHDAEDGGWQFLTGAVFHLEDGKLVTLQSMVERDASLLTLADLPPGWQAQRERKDCVWVRRPTSPADS